MQYLLQFTFGAPVHYVRTNPFLQHIKSLLVQLCFNLPGLAAPI